METLCLTFKRISFDIDLFSIAHKEESRLRSGLVQWPTIFHFKAHWDYLRELTVEAIDVEELDLLDFMNQ